MSDACWLSLPYWEKVGHPEGWATLAGGLLAALGTVVSVGIAAYLTYRYTRLHSKAAHNTEVRMDRLRREISALEQIWELLAYMSFRESKQAILLWREDKASGEPKQYFVNFENLKVFLLERISEVVYQRHAGLHLPHSIRDRLFDYAGSLMGLYLRYKDAPEGKAGAPPILLANPHLIDKLQKAYHELNKSLKEELENRYRLVNRP